MHRRLHFFQLPGRQCRAPRAALAQLFERGRLDEHADDIARQSRAQLAEALPVNVEQNVLPLSQSGLDRAARRAVGTAEHLRIFEKFVRRHHGVERVLLNEMIVLTIHLAGARRAGGDADREMEFRVRRQQSA